MTQRRLTDLATVLRKAGLKVEVSIPTYTDPSWKGYVLNNPQVYLGWVPPEDHSAVQRQLDSEKSILTKAKATLDSGLTEVSVGGRSYSIEQVRLDCKTRLANCQRLESDLALKSRALATLDSTLNRGKQQAQHDEAVDHDRKLRPLERLTKSREHQGPTWHNDREVPQRKQPLTQAVAGDRTSRQDGHAVIQAREKGIA